jgi:hypothetical protein
VQESAFVGLLADVQMDAGLAVAGLVQRVSGGLEISTIHRGDSLW